MVSSSAQAGETSFHPLHGHKTVEANQAAYTIQGTVAPGYEAVRDLFERHFADGVEDKAQVCAYVRGQKVVDLWGESHEDKNAVGSTTCDYGPDGLQNIFSSGKSITSLVVAMLVDRGHLTYDQKISEIWPEFTADEHMYDDADQLGKRNTTVAHLMRHEAGLQKFSPTHITSGPLAYQLPMGELTTDKIREGSVSRTRFIDRGAQCGRA